MKDKLFWLNIRGTGIVPHKRLEDAGYDLYADVEGDIVFKPFETKLIPTGLSTAFSSDYVALVHERGSTGSIGLKSSAGVVDSGYRGEIFVALYNANDKPLTITDMFNKTEVFLNEIYYPKSKAIAQLVLANVPCLESLEVTMEEYEKMESHRGSGALGSSNK